MFFTVEETNLMCCFDTSSRKRLIAEMKSLPINELDDEMAELLFHILFLAATLPRTSSSTAP